MVSYQTMIRLGFDVAESKTTVDGIDEGADLMSGLSTLWNEDKERIKQLTEEQARNYLSDRITA